MQTVKTRNEMVAIYGEDIINRLDAQDWDLEYNLLKGLETGNDDDLIPGNSKSIFLDDEKHTMLSFHKSWTWGRSNCYVVSCDD